MKAIQPSKQRSAKCRVFPSGVKLAALPSLPRNSLMASKNSMTAAEFDALIPRLGRLTVDTVSIAREVLVDGLPQSKAAEKHGVTKQRVSDMIARVVAAANDVPRDWQRVEVWLPPHLAEQVRAMEVQAKADAASRAE